MLFLTKGCLSYLATYCLVAVSPASERISWPTLQRLHRIHPGWPYFVHRDPMRPPYVPHLLAVPTSDNQVLTLLWF